jgi:hypothetical protein
MADETWFTAKEAMDFGLINRVFDGEPVENKYDLTIYNKAPEKLLRQKENVTKREVERALRDAGCSLNMAKAILSGGWQEDDNQRDVEPPEVSTLEESNLRDEEEMPIVIDECDIILNKFKELEVI